MWSDIDKYHHACQFMARYVRRADVWMLNDNDVNVEIFRNEYVNMIAEGLADGTAISSAANVQMFTNHPRGSGSIIHTILMRNNGNINIKIST